MNDIKSMRVRNIEFVVNYDTFVSEHCHEVRKSEKDNLLDLIYSPDPVTKLPNSDVSVYLSANTNPQVKQFILDNLLYSNSSMTPPAIPDGVDVDLTDLHRFEAETPYEYAQRISRYFVQDEVTDGV